jgi:A1 cistron-splicing factor AAR2
MDPEAATELVRKGVTLLLLDVPQHTVLGVDTQVATLHPPPQKTPPPTGGYS